MAMNKKLLQPFIGYLNCYWNSTEEVNFPIGVTIKENNTAFLAHFLQAFC